jgi:hypothetical protein
MYISVGGTALTVEALQSDNGTALYVGIPGQLVDGRPGTPAAIQWTSGLQSTASWVSLVFKLTPQPTVALPARLFCIVFNKLGDPTASTRVNRSSGNQPWMAMRVPFQKADVTVTPMRFDNAFISSQNIRKHFLKLMQTKYMMVLLRSNQRGESTVDDDYVQNMSMLVRMTDMGTIQSDASQDYWPVQASFEELL